MSDLKAEDLEVGKTYSVVGNDCCVHVEFEDKLTEVKWIDDGEGGTIIDEVIFGKIRLIDWFYAYEFKEVSNVD